MYTKRQKGWIKHLDFIVLDQLAIVLSLGISFWLRHGLSHGQELVVMYIKLLLLTMLVNFLIIFLEESYKNIVRRGYIIEMKKVFFHSIFVDMIILSYLFIVHQTQLYSRKILVCFLFLQLLITYTFRCINKYHIRNKMRNSSDVEQMLIITDAKKEKQCVEELSKDLYRNYRVIGVVRTDCNRIADLSINSRLSEENADEVDMHTYEKQLAATAENLSSKMHMIIGYDQLEEYLLRHVVDSVFINTDMDEYRKKELIELLEKSGVTVHLNLIRMPHGLSDRAVERLGNYVVISSGMRITTMREKILKRVLDIIGGFLGVLFTLIITIFLAPIIFIQSPGPIFFRQDRVGKNGRIFKMYKFRSMYPDAEERKKELQDYNQMNGLMFKMENDPRIIPIGRFIRKYSLDEFPQFFNVLKGDMSLVGTRPPTIDEYEQYQIHQKGRLNSKPGLTGLWQVSGRSDITDFEEVVRLDKEYIETWSFGNDIRILLKTAWMVVRGKGAQ